MTSTFANQDLNMVESIRTQKITGCWQIEDLKTRNCHIFQHQECSKLSPVKKAAPNVPLTRPYHMLKSSAILNETNTREQGFRLFSPLASEDDYFLFPLVC